MEKKKRDDKKPKQRFSKDKYGEFIRKNYATRKTAELAEILGLEEKPVKDYAYREKSEEREGLGARKDPAYLSEIRGECGKKGGRPRKKTYNKKQRRFLCWKFFFTLPPKPLRSGGKWVL